MSAASSSAYYTDIHVRPQLAEAEGDLVSVEFGSPHVTRDGINGWAFGLAFPT